MDFFELLAKGENTPVLCVDGAVGMLVEYPLGDAHGALAGIKVPGELDLRWIAHRELHRVGNALRQTGSPPRPLVLDLEGDSADTILMRTLLRELWQRLGTPDHLGTGVSIPWGKGNRA